jgi:hypothetical protein
VLSSDRNEKPSVIIKNEGNRSASSIGFRCKYGIELIVMQNEFTSRGVCSVMQRSSF